MKQITQITPMDHIENRLPAIPAEYEKGSTWYKFCELFLKTPNIDYVLQQVGYADNSSESRKQVARDLRTSDGPIARFITQTELVFYDKQQLRQRDSAVKTIATDLYSTLPVDELTLEERLFVYNYAGNTKEALVAAGLKPTTKQKLMILKNPLVRECKEVIDGVLFASDIVSTSETLWVMSNIIRDPISKPADRLAAAKLILQHRGELAAADKKQNTVNVQINTHIK